MTVETKLVKLNGWELDSEGWYHHGCDMYAVTHDIIGQLGQCPGCGVSIPEQETAEYQLTRQDINALRQANNVCFDHDPVDKRRDVYAGCLRALKNRSVQYREKHPFDDHTATHSIPVKESVIHTYSIPTEEREAIKQTGRGYVYAISGYYDSHLTTIWALLKPGDIIRLKWCYDAGSQVVGDHNLHTDRLYLEIYRDGNKPRTFRFFIDEQTGLDNSARMIKRK